MKKVSCIITLLFLLSICASAQPIVNKVIPLTTPFPGRDIGDTPFYIGLEGDGFEAGCEVVITNISQESKGCEKGCVIPYDVLTEFGKVSQTSISRFPVTLREGLFEISVHTPTGKKSNSVHLKVPSVSFIPQLAMMSTLFTYGTKIRDKSGDESLKEQALSMLVPNSPQAKLISSGKVPELLCRYDNLAFKVLQFLEDGDTILVTFVALAEYVGEGRLNAKLISPKKHTVIFRRINGTWLLDL